MQNFNNVKEEKFNIETMPYLGELFRTAAKFVKNRVEAEDLVQEVYLQAWKSFHRYEPETNCRAWLHKILSNKLKSHYFKENKFKYVEDSDEAFRNLKFNPTVAEKLTDEELLLSLQAVPPRFRQAMLLADVEEFSYKEIAEILNVPIGTVMSRVSRGRKLLRIALINRLYSPEIKPESKNIFKLLLGKLKIAQQI